MMIADVVGVLLILLLLPAVFLYGNVYCKGRGLLLLLCVGAHVALAVLSVAGIMLEPEKDNLGFHLGALEFLTPWREFSLQPTSDNWEYLVSWVYWPFGPSMFLGYAVNQWIFFALVVNVLRFSEEVGLNHRYQTLIVLLFSFFPSSLLYCNFLYRESFQTLGLVIIVRNMEKYRRDGSAKFLLKILLAGIPFGMIHNGFFLFVPMALMLAVLGRMLLTTTRKRSPGRDLAVAALGLVLIGSAIGTLATLQENRRITQISEGDIDVAESMAHAMNVSGARTVFPWQPSSGIQGTIVFAPVQLFQFLFCPVFPFLVSEPQDLVAVIDVLLRVAFLWLAFLAYRRGSREQRKMIIFLLATYLLFCLLAAIGTTTVGTAMRHQLKVSWIPFALGFLALQRRAGRVRRARPYPAVPRDPSLRPRTYRVGV